MNSSSGLLRRINIIAASGASRILSSFSNLIISFAVIRLYSSGLWGEVVSYILILDFAFSFISWGATPYLIREFSLSPKNMEHSWGQSTASRSLLLIASLPLLFFIPAPFTLKVYFAIWAAARFVYHSFEPVLQFERNFVFSLWVELLAIAIIIVSLLLIPGISTEKIILLICISAAWRALAHLWFYRSKIILSAPSLNFFSEALPFLLLTFSATLQQRSDLYSVAYFLDDHETARYQVFINLLIFSQFGASLLLSPFAKNIFRLSKTAFLKLERSFMMWGFILSAGSLIIVYLLTHFFYGFTFSWKMYALGYFYVVMFYLYLLRNYELGKLRKQTRVALYSFAASGFNLAVSFFLTPNLGIEGALLAGTLAQLFLVGLYHQKKFIKHAAG